MAAVVRMAAGVVVAVVAGETRPAVPATMPIYRRAQASPGPLSRTQVSQEAMLSATNMVATMASDRSTHIAAVNRAAAGSARGRAENPVDIRVASRRAVVRAVAVVKVASPVARAQAAVAAATAARAVAASPAASRAWVDD